MLIEEFIARAAAEPETTVAQTISRPSGDVLAKAAGPGGVSMSDFLASAHPRTERRDIRYGHVLGRPASEHVLRAWQRSHSCVLPADLIELLKQVNGIHLWADATTGRSYIGLAPIEEWERARTKFYGSDAPRDLLDDRYIAVSYHQDGASLIVLDLESKKYFLMDAAGPDESAPIGGSVSDLLDWLWEHRFLPGQTARSKTE